MQITKNHIVIGTLVLALLAGIIVFTNNKDVGTQAVATPTPDAQNTEPTVTPVESPVGTVVTNTVTGRPVTNLPVQKVPAPLTGRVAPDLVRPTGFSNTDTLGLINTNEFTLKQFIGKKIILLEFWTTSSVNSLHTIPYLNQWQEKYKDQGLLIVTVHTPRFEFEKSKSVVDKVAHDNNMISPIVMDTEYNTWAAYKNTVWPHLYLIDLNGRIVYDHAGEGAYEATHAKIEELLSARAKTLKTTFNPSSFAIPKGASSYDFTGIEAYVGAGRNATLANGVPLKIGQQSFEPVVSPKSDVVYLTGNWNFTKDYAENMTPSSVIFRHSTKSVGAVLGAQKIIRVKVLLDGNPLDGTNAGKDVRFEKTDSVIYVSEERIYSIMNNPSQSGEHTVELISDSGGLDVYTLTFI